MKWPESREQNFENVSPALETYLLDKLNAQTLVLLRLNIALKQAISWGFVLTALPGNKAEISNLG